MSLRRGSVLILAVWVIALLSLLAAGLGSQAMAALGLVDRMDHRLQASYIAAAGAQRALSTLANDRTAKIDGFTDEWAACPACFQRQPLADGYFTIAYGVGQRAVNGLIDEERKLSLNTAPPEVLQQLLQVQAQLSARDADEIADAIVDWRDEDHEKREHGAENFYYEGLSPSYPCKDAPFEQVEELLLVRGVTPEIFDRIAPWVTAYGSGRINVNTAGEPVWRALGLSAPSVKVLLAYRDGEDGLPGTGDEHVFGSVESAFGELSAVLSVDDMELLTKLAGESLFTVDATAFTAEIRGVSENEEASVAVRCTMTPTGQILAWSEQ